MRPKAQFIVHQCAQFSADPNLPHNQAVKKLLKYHKGKSDNRLIMKLDTEKWIEFYVDADFFLR